MIEILAPVVLGFVLGFAAAIPFVLLSPLLELVRAWVKERGRE